MLRRSILAAALSLVAAAPAFAASSVAYIDNHNAWLASPDGVHKYQLTTGGDETASWMAPAQGPDGKTVVAHKDTFENGDKRPVLYLYGADGKVQTANVMPVSASANIPVYPIGMDIDWDSKTVAFGYSYCTFACNSTVRGYWLAFSDGPVMDPSRPQGQTDAYNPTFYGRRIVSVDSGGGVFVQPDEANAPFTNNYQGWLRLQGFRFSRAEVSAAGNMVALEWTQYDANYNKVGEGITIGNHQGTVPSDLSNLCDLNVAAGASNLTFSPDGTQIAWSDAEGVKVAGVPDLATCTHKPITVISPTGKWPSFGGADVEAIVNPKKGGGGSGPAPGPAAPKPGSGGDGGPQPGPSGTIAVALSGKATSALFAKGRVTVTVDAPAAGRVAVAASVPSKLARKLRLTRAGAARLATAAGAKGFASAASVVVANGSASADGPGKVTVKLKPTKAAKRAAKKLRGVTLSLKVTQGAVSGEGKLKLR